jgi:two-component system repressor protein LuxO
MPSAASLADGGSLFLDEIGEMDLALQSKLLRFVQTGTFQKVGSNTLERVDVRFICATNRDPLQMVEDGTFREDLYYRLHVIPIHLPPLRDCGRDVLDIAEKYLLAYSKEESKRFSGFEPQAQELLLRYRWPGNVRQLQNVVRNIVVLQDGEQVTAAMLPQLMQGRPDPGAPGRNPAAAAPPSAPVQPATPAAVGEGDIRPLWQVEKDAIEQAIAACDGNIPKAAALLELSPSTIYRKRMAWTDQA